MSVTDCFIVNDEIELIDLRMRELAGVVDCHYAVELPVDFRGRPKPLHVREAMNAGRLPRDGKLQLGVIPEEIPTGPHPQVEIFQRNLLGAAWATAPKGDVFLMGDVDEIPSVSAVTKFSDPEYPFAIAVCHQELYAGSDQWRRPGGWYGTALICAGRYKVGQFENAQKIRDVRGFAPTIMDGGWHLTAFGGPEAVKRKLATLDIARDIEITGQQGKMTAPDPDNELAIHAFLRAGRDLYGRAENAERVTEHTPGVSLPLSYFEWLEDYPEMNQR